MAAHRVQEGRGGAPRHHLQERADAQERLDVDAPVPDSQVHVKARGGAEDQAPHQGSQEGASVEAHAEARGGFRGGANGEVRHCSGVAERGNGLEKTQKGHDRENCRLSAVVVKEVQATADQERGVVSSRHARLQKASASMRPRQAWALPRARLHVARQTRSHRRCSRGGDRSSSSDSDSANLSQSLCTCHTYHARIEHRALRKR